MTPKVNLNAVIAGAAKKLEAAGIDAGAVEAEIVLCELLDFDRLHLYLHGPTVIDDKLLEEFDAIIEKRTTRYPLQFLLGTAWFYNRRFIVNEAVMIPCPETEQLLETALSLARRCTSDPVRLLDIGAGSGAWLPRSYRQLGTERPPLEYAVDVPQCGTVRNEPRTSAQVGFRAG